MQDRMSSDQFQRMFNAKYSTQLDALGIQPKGEATKTVTLTLDCHPPSANNAYYTDKKRFQRHLTKDGYAFHRQIAALLAGRKIAPAEWYSLSLTFSLSLKTKEGNVRRWDQSNRVKLAEDAIFEALGIDDSRNKKMTVEKIEGPVGMIAIVEAMPGGNLKMF